MDNKIAVVIRGQFRTWDFCKKQTFHVFESRYSDIDWYFITWEDSVTEKHKQSLLTDFENKRAEIKILHRDETGNNSWNSQRRLGYEISDKVSNYSQVFELRPDVYLQMNDEHKFPNNTNKWFVTGLRSRQELCRENGKYIKKIKTSINDWFYIQTPNIFHIFTNSYKEEMKLEGPRAQLVDIAYTNNIEIEDISPIVTPLVLRPTYTPDTLFGHEKMWMGLTSKEKIELLNSLNIMTQDYKTNNRFISV